jgi:MFS family permease
MGGAMPNAIALTSEYMPSQQRATAVTAMMCGFSLGAAVGGFVAAALIPRFGWESVFVAGGAVPLLIVPIAAVALPESIRFLLAVPTVRPGARVPVPHRARRSRTSLRRMLKHLARALSSPGSSRRSSRRDPADLGRVLHEPAGPCTF